MIEIVGHRLGRSGLHMSLGETMTITEIMPATDRSKSRKFKAILAGGLVLGLGAAVTLAAWNDSEFVIGNFGSGHFEIEGSPDGTTFGNHASGSPATLGFSTGYNNLSPNETVAAPYVLHLDKDSKYTASVTVATASATGDDNALDNLTYGIIKVNSVAGCTPTATGTEVIPPNTSIGTVVDGTPFVLATSAALGTDPGADTFLCIQVKAGAPLQQSKSATATWEFRAASAPMVP
jgi:predicted ribosomally synthesized peptide with SipW-like signal peptide